MDDFPLRRNTDGTEELTISMRGSDVLQNNMYNRGTAFTAEQRVALGLDGLLPNAVRDFKTQTERAYAHVCGFSHPLTRYVALADLEARNAVLFYNVIANHIEELLPIVYTPTVGEACQKYSHLFRRGRGLWITPEHRGRVADVLRNAPYQDVRLIVATDNERILGLGDQGAGGMGIPVGKLVLYTVGAGIHPTQVLPISLDVGTDNKLLLDNPFYVGWRHERLRGPEYDALVEEFVEAVREVFPNALLQWEDFKKGNAFRLLDTYRERILSFNDDIQGTAGIALAGVMAATRVTGTPMSKQRVVMVGAGAAGVGIARILRAAMRSAGASEKDVAGAICVLDSRGVLVEGREIRERYKHEFVLPAGIVRELGLDPSQPIGLEQAVRTFKPTVLIGTSGTPGTFDEATVRAMAESVERPVILPFSNPNSKAEALPSDLVTWTDGRALIASGSPFDPVHYEGREIAIGQGNNVYIFPGVGLGALAVGATEVVDEMFTAAARTVAGMVDDTHLAKGQLYPPLSELRAISRAVAIAVGQSAVAAKVAPALSEAEIVKKVDQMMWAPRYPEVKVAE